MMNYVSRVPIQKGWSNDKKYCITDEQGQMYLLRISSAETYHRKQQEFDRMGQAASTGISMCKPIEFGICEEGVYSIQSWIDGTDAEILIPQMTRQQQYHYGFEAGQMLRTIHTIPVPKELDPWPLYFNRKLDRKLQIYQDCPIKYKHGAYFIDYIEAHRTLLNGRPRTYQHGDYHIGNMIIDRSGQLTIIDFNRDDFGDPWEEFNRIVWSAQASPVFASAMVNGYFEDEVPPEFWALLALYISSNTLSSVAWAIPFGEAEISTMLHQAEEVLSWYHNMQTTIPTWYQGLTP